MKGGSKCTELVSSTRKLASGQDKTSKSALVAAVELLFCLPQFGTMSSSVWDFHTTVTEGNPTGTNMKEIQLGNAVAIPVERKSQTEEDKIPNRKRQKSSSIAATNALLEVLS